MRDTKPKRKAKGQAEERRRSARRNSSRHSLPQSPHWKQITPGQKAQRSQAFKLLRLRREGMSWRDAQEQSGITTRTAQRYFPKAFYRDSGGKLQVTDHDRYVEQFRLPTTRPGKLEVVRARGSRERSLCGRWLNALKAAGDGDFGPIDAFPKNVFIDGYRLSTSHYVVQRIDEALSESEHKFDELYALAGAR